MARRVTSTQLVQIIGDVAPCLIKRKDEHEIPALLSLQGLVQKRVHNEGRDVDGKTRSYSGYPSAYTKAAKKRSPKVDMTLSRKLQDDYNVYRNEGDNVLGFKNEDSRQKILAEENRRGTGLYVPNEEELDRAFKIQIRLIKKIAKQCLK